MDKRLNNETEGITPPSGHACGLRRCEQCGYTVSDPMIGRCPRCWLALPAANCGGCNGCGLHLPSPRS